LDDPSVSLIGFDMIAVESQREWKKERNLF